MIYSTDSLKLMDFGLYTFKRISDRIKPKSEKKRKKGLGYTNLRESAIDTKIFANS